MMWDKLGTAQEVPFVLLHMLKVSTVIHLQKGKQNFSSSLFFFYWDQYCKPKNLYYLSLEIPSTEETMNVMMQSSHLKQAPSLYSSDCLGLSNDWNTNMSCTNNMLNHNEHTTNVSIYSFSSQVFVDFYLS